MEHRSNKLVTTFLDECEKLEIHIKKEVCREIMDELIIRTRWMVRIMERGRPILEQADGYRLSRLLRQRNRVWDKINTFNEAYNMVFKLYEKYNRELEALAHHPHKINRR